MSFKVPNQYRVRNGPMASSDSIGRYGMFQLSLTFNGSTYSINTDGDSMVYIVAAAGDDSGWEHVSAHVRTPDGPRTPDWALMCIVKNLFWDEEDCVIQFHPPKSEYVNRNPNVLHLWRRHNTNWETPPKILIG